MPICWENWAERIWALSGHQAWSVREPLLIISKLYWAKDSHSELQLRDVKNLIATGYDAAYLEYWTNRLDLHTLWEKCLHG
jgi:hypothetical protein